MIKKRKNTKQSFVRIQPKVRIRLRAYCRRRGLVMGTLVTEIVSAHLDLIDTTQEKESKAHK